MYITPNPHLGGVNNNYNQYKNSMLGNRGASFNLRKSRSFTKLNSKNMVISKQRTNNRNFECSKLSLYEQP